MVSGNSPLFRSWGSLWFCPLQAFGCAEIVFYLVDKDLAVSHLMVFQGSPSFLEGFFADGGNAGMTYLPMRAGVKDEENIISSLFLKFQIAHAFTVLINASDSNKTVHRFTLRFIVCQISDRRPILKESVIAHQVL